MANTDYLYCDGKGCALAITCRRYTEGQRIKRNLHRDESQYYWNNHCDPETRELYTTTNLTNFTNGTNGK